MFWSVSLVIITLWSELQANPISIFADNKITSKKFEAVLEGRCLKNANTKAYNQLKASTPCAAPFFLNPTNLKDAVNIVCNQVRQASYNCQLGAMKKLEPCLDSEEKYLPNFLLGGHNRSFEQVCTTNGISKMQEVFSSLGSVECDPPVKAMVNLLVMSCLPKIRSLKILSNSSYLFTEANVCSDLQTTKECFSNVITSHCNNAEGLAEWVGSNIDPFLVPCGATYRK